MGGKEKNGQKWFCAFVESNRSWTERFHSQGFFHLFLFPSIKGDESSILTPGSSYL